MVQTMQSKVWKHSIEGNINLCLLKMQKSKTHYSYSLCNACQLFNFPWYNLSHLSKCISGWPFSFPSLSFHLLMINPQWFFISTVHHYYYVLFLFRNEIKIVLPTLYKDQSSPQNIDNLVYHKWTSTSTSKYFL